MPKINFVKEKVIADAADGDNLRSIARKNGVQLYSGPHKVFNCMGFGHCGSCNVIVKKGSDNCSRKGLLESLWKWAHPLLGLKVLSNEGKDVRLACQAKVHGDMEIETHPPVNWHGDKFWG
ncbi:MAG: (2Fe-2S)-binding protein [Fuerstiella sp.]|nr:(2Fe-2S)-binding protein [Fuerstiella sp.]